MEEKKIVVVMGGPSSEAAISRQTGRAVVEALQSKGHAVVGLEFVPRDFAHAIEAMRPAVVFNAMPLGGGAGSFGDSLYRVGGFGGGPDLG